MTVEERIAEIDAMMPYAEVSLLGLRQVEFSVAVKITDTFEVPFGSLIRRADAIELAGGQPTYVHSLQEAAQHLVMKNPDI